MKRFPVVLICLATTFFVDAQNVGIGTLTPQAKLHIYNGASGITPFATARLVVETNDHSYINLLSPDPFETGILFGSGTNAASGVISYNSSGISKGFLFSTNGNQQRMVINSAGNVGIGTINPQKNLSIQNGMNIDQADANTGSVANAITFGNGSGEGIGSKRNAGGNQWGLDFYTNSTNRMSITNGGNVGIGTTSPAAKLQISAGDASFALFGPNASYGGMLYVGSSPVNQSAALTAQVFASDGNLHIDPAQGHNIYIGYYQARDIFLNPNGAKVGIGTTSPASTLEVNGYTKLGSNAPSIKVIKLTGTTAPTEGGFVQIVLGLDISKILSVSVMVVDSFGEWFEPNTGGSFANFYWIVITSLGKIEIVNRTGESANILSKPFVVLITYEE